MNQYLVFQLYGPIVSFGDIAVGEYRTTFAHPTKSAVLGLIAGALGLRREQSREIQSLADVLKFSTGVINSGHFLRDYHTTQVPSAVDVKRRPAHTRKDELSIKDQNTILSTRDYRTDGYYIAAVWKNSSDSVATVSLDQIHSAMQRPGFLPYLGRKSCPPSLPFDPQIIESESAESAIQKYGLASTEKMLDLISGKKNRDSLLWPLNSSTFSVYKDMEGHEPDKGTVQVFTRKDRLISRKNWQYGDRKEIMITVGG